MLAELGADAAHLAGSTFYYGKGCDACHHTGYRGRTGLFEMLRFDDSIRNAVLSGASTAEIRASATRAGMRSLRSAGLMALTDGRTTLEEVLRETL